MYANCYERRVGLSARRDGEAVSNHFDSLDSGFRRVHAQEDAKPLC